MAFYLLKKIFTLAICVCLIWSAQSHSSTAIVEVVTEPDSAGTVHFSGTPEGQIGLPQGSLTESNLRAGTYTSKIDTIDPALIAAGYKLVSVHCDDKSSGQPSQGDVASRSTTFNLEEDETVVCLFKFATHEVDPGDGGGGGGGGDNGSDIGGGDGDQGGNGGIDGGQGNNGGTDGDCVCPQEGAWNVSNLTGEMVCIGVMSMTMPLKASNDVGQIETSNNCDTLTASGLSDDEATIIFQRTDNCTYKGTVGGSHEGIPMEIDFTLNVANQRNMSGSLHSVVNESGMTCTMSRDYNLRHSN